MQLQVLPKTEIPRYASKLFLSCLCVNPKMAEAKTIALLCLDTTIEALISIGASEEHIEFYRGASVFIQTEVKS